MTQDEIKALSEENKTLREWIKARLNSSCEGCDYYNYNTRACSYECNHPEHGCWLEGGGYGCEDHTEMKILDSE